MEMNSLPRWLISITDMPLPCQSSISSAALRSTGSGRVEGPGLKLKARVMGFSLLAGDGKRGAPAFAPKLHSIQERRKALLEDSPPVTPVARSGIQCG